MKKEKLKRGIASAILTLMVSSVTLVGCKDDKDENKPVVPPMIQQSHSINGNVYDNKGAALTDVAVNMELDGKSAGTATTDSKGEFKFASIKKSGKYLLTFTKAKYHTTTANLAITDELKSSVMLYVPITMANEGVTKEIAIAGGEIALGDKTGSIPNVTFTVPDKALSKAETITITPISDIVNVSSGSVTNYKNGLPLLTLACAPSQLKFTTPCKITIPNPLSEFSISGLKLMYNNGSEWSVQPQKVQLVGTNYVTTVNHFSTYQVAFETTVATPVASTEIITDIKGIDNFDGKQSIKVETIPYTFKSGYVYDITVDQALATAGIKGADVAKIKSIIEESVKSKNNGMNAGYKTNNGLQVINQTIPIGARLDASGVQNFSTVKYTISFEKNGTKYPVTVSVKIAGSVSITTQAYNKEHQGGNAGI